MVFNRNDPVGFTFYSFYILSFSFVTGNEAHKKESNDLIGDALAWVFYSPPHDDLFLSIHPNSFRSPALPLRASISCFVTETFLLPVPLGPLPHPISQNPI